MNSYSLSLGTLALTLSLVVSGLPAIAFANESTSTLEASRTKMLVELRDHFFDSRNATTSVRSFEDVSRDIDDSIATTTRAEMRIKSRGFFAHFFFGGDKTSANVITQATAQNQWHLESLNKLLDDTTLPTDRRATLNARMTALEDTQAHLKDLADTEQKSWGLFSWRFGGK